MYNEYPKDYFQIKHQDGINKFYFRIDNKDIEVSEEIFRICKRSQDKIQYNIRKQATQSIIHYENIDDVAFLFTQEYLNNDILNDLFLNDLIDTINAEIHCLHKKYRSIAICIFIHGMTEMETARFLTIPKSTVHDRKIKIQKILKEILKKYG